MMFRYRLRLQLFTLLLFGGFAALVLRLWAVQIEDHEKYVRLVPGTSEVTIRVPGTRGEIKDRNGVTLVTNKINYEVVFNLEDIVAEYRREKEAEAKREGVKFKMPMTSYTIRENGQPRYKEHYDVPAILDEFVMPRLQALGIWVEWRSNAVNTHWRTYKGLVPFVYRDKLSYEEFARVAEHDLDLPGVSINARPIREYLFDSLACHILGYVAKPDIDKVALDEQRRFNHYVPDEFGVAGIEKSMDLTLRGKEGKRTMLKDEKGIIQGEISYEPPVKGSDIFLTIDARIQSIAEDALRDANGGVGFGRAAAVVVDPKTGDILAMASVPSFNPNRFIPSISKEEWAQYTGNPVKPLVNLATRSFPPGSTFKIPVSFAGMLAGIDGIPQYCAGTTTFVKRPIKCWIADKGGSHGSLGLSEAIMRSCNCFFYQYGNKAGIKNIKQVAEFFNLGKPTGIELENELGGIVPDPDWKQLNWNLPWSADDTAYVSIGQSACEATPLQMAYVASVVANGGKCWKPQLVDKTVEFDGTNQVAKLNPSELRYDLTLEGISPEQVERVRRGMWRVVNDLGGTAKRAKSEQYEVAGKTGTAQRWRWDDELKQNVKDNISWFITFAPYDNPLYAVCVMVQNGKSGGGVASPVAARILEQSIAYSQGYDVRVEPVQEVAGNFLYTEATTYDEGDPAAAFLAAAEDDDADTGAVAEDAIPKPKAVPRAVPAVAAPTVREEADRRGSQAPDVQPIEDQKFERRDSGADDEDRPRNRLFRRR